MLDSSEREPLLSNDRQRSEQNEPSHFWAGKDRALAWIVAASIFLINFITIGLGRMSGILYVDFMRQYGVNREAASAPFSVQQSTRNLFGPLVGVLGHKFGIRAVTIAGGLIGASSSIACAFAEDITWITIFWGGIYGISIAFTSTLSQIILDNYFERHLSSASGFIFSGGPVGAIVFAVTLQQAIDYYGLRNSYIIMGVVILLVVPLAITLTNPPWPLSNLSMTSNEEEHVTKGKRLKSNLQLSGSYENHGGLDSAKDEMDAKLPDLEPHPSTSYDPRYRPKDNTHEPKNYGSIEFDPGQFAKGRSFNPDELSPRIKLLYTSFFPLDVSDVIDIGAVKERSRVSSGTPGEDIFKKDNDHEKSDLLESSQNITDTECIATPKISQRNTDDKTYEKDHEDQIMKEKLKLLKTSTPLRTSTGDCSEQIVSMPSGVSSYETDIGSGKNDDNSVEHGKIIQESKISTEIDIEDNSKDIGTDSETKRNINLLTTSFALSNAPDESSKEIIANLIKDELNKDEREGINAANKDQLAIEKNKKPKAIDKDYETNFQSSKSKSDLEFTTGSLTTPDVRGKILVDSGSGKNIDKKSDSRSKKENANNLSSKNTTKTVTQASKKNKDFGVASGDTKIKTKSNLLENSGTLSSGKAKNTRKIVSKLPIGDITDDQNKSKKGPFNNKKVIKTYSPKAPFESPGSSQDTVKKVTPGISEDISNRKIDAKRKEKRETTKKKEIRKKKLPAQARGKDKNTEAPVDGNERNLLESTAVIDPEVTLSSQDISSKEIDPISKNEGIDVENKNYTTKSNLCTEIRDKEKDSVTVLDETKFKDIKNSFAFLSNVKEKAETTDPDISTMKDFKGKERLGDLLDSPVQQGKDISLINNEVCKNGNKSKEESSLLETSFVASDRYQANLDTSSNSIDIKFLRQNEYYVAKILQNSNNKFVLEELEHLYNINDQKENSTRMKYPSTTDGPDYSCESCGRSFIETNEIFDVEAPPINSENNERRLQFFNHLKNSVSKEKSDILSDFDESGREHVGKIVDELKKVYAFAEKNKVFKSQQESKFSKFQSPSNNGKCHQCSSFIRQLGLILKLYLNPAFLLICLCRAVHLMTYMGILTVIVDFTMDRGMRERDGRYAAAVMSLGDLIGRLCTGWITDYMYIRQERFMLLAMVLTGAISASLPVLPPSSLLLCIGIYSLLLGSVFIRHPVLVSKYTKRHERTVGMGFMTLFSGLLGFVLPVYIGHFRDGVGSYNPIFYINGGISILIGCLWIFEPFLRRYEG